MRVQISRSLGRRQPAQVRANLHARYYDPKLGIFTQGDWWDPTLPGVGPNRYAYSHGDPVNFSDALSLVMAADAVSPAQLVVPLGAEGRRTFRLQALAAANGVAHTRAHDALSDVLATLELCRLVFQRSPEL